MVLHAFRVIPRLVAAVVLPGIGPLPASAIPKLVVTNARIFTLAAGPEAEAVSGHLVVAADGTVQAIGTGAPPPALVESSPERWDAEGKWILPGFISAHSHLWQSAYRGLASDQTLMGWVRALYFERAVRAGPEDLYWFTLDGALDHLRHGITGAYNFNYANTADKAAAFAEQQFRAERDAGIRFIHGANLGRVGPGWTPAQARTQLAAFLAWTREQKDTPGFLGVMLNGAGAFVDTPAQAQAEAEVMRALGVGNQTHFLESPPDKFAERGKFRWLLDAGLLGPGLIFGHFIHTDPWIVAETAKAGAAMSWNPLSNGRLASGVVDIPAYRRAGLRIGMGVDGQASADRADPFENLRMGLYQVRARYEDAAVLSPYDVLRMHTLGSADALGVADRLGTLEVGKLADFIVLDPARLGPVVDPYASIVFVAGAGDVIRVYVGGELRVRDGQVLTPLYATARTEVARRIERLSAP